MKDQIKCPHCKKTYGELLNLTRMDLQRMLGGLMSLKPEGRSITGEPYYDLGSSKIGLYHMIRAVQKLIKMAKNKRRKT